MTLDPASPETSLVIANVSRRKFLQASALGGLVLAVGFPASVRAADAPKYGADGMPHGWVDSPLVFVAIGEDGIVSIVCHRSEMGQGVRTGMPMIVADELEADWSRVRVVQATGDEARYGNQDTDGSRSTRHFFMPMRRCGAAARQMLETAAAARWKVPVSEVQAKNGEVIHTANRPEARLRRAREGSGERAAAGDGQGQAEGSLAVSLHRHRQAEAGRCAGHRHRQNALRHGHAPARPALRRGRAAASVWRHGQELRRSRDAQGTGRRESRADRGHAGRARVQSARRRGRDREQYVGRDAGTQGAADRVGRRSECDLRLRRVPEDAGRGRKQAGAGRSQRRRLRQGGGRGVEAHHG